MESNIGYIYIRNHPSYDLYDVCKMGKTKNIPERDSTYLTGEIKRGYFDPVFEIPIKKMEIVERLLQNEFKELNVKYDAGIEFFNKNIVNLIEPYLNSIGITYKKLSKHDIHNLVRFNRIRNIVKKINISSFIKAIKLSCHIDNSYKDFVWNERDYQKTIINYSKNMLSSYNKIYIELPTGGGKSYIVYNLFKYLQSDFIVIISPRKIVNSQNISKKYLQILSAKYITFNYSIDNNIDDFLMLDNKKILICCTQSIHKIYDTIIEYSIVDIAIWFDEAHWGIEDWINNMNDISNFWLLDNVYIKYRIFTSASPNKSKVLENEHIFGQLYVPIKIKELIQLKWLSEIKPYIYSENIINIDNIKYILYDFIDKNRKYGFSFHNKQKNAFNLFYRHYIQYKNNETHIKPFLLVSTDFTIDCDISLDYDYRNIKIYESMIYSIGYVVAKYSIGYDFNKLDFICFSDPKLSIQDIKQCIGRGIRPDELDINGTNKDKILIISLPVYIDNNESDKYGNESDKYEKIIEVLKYLLYDIEIPFEEIDFKDRHTEHSHNANIPLQHNEYLGTNHVKSILLNLLELDNKRNSLTITYEKARKIIADKNIKSKESYYEICEIDTRLSKEPEIVFNGQFTNWIEYLSIERMYYDLETCKNKVNEYLLSQASFFKDYLDLLSISIELSKIDPLFPPAGLWVEYYDVSDLSYIIIDVKKKYTKKKNGIVI